MPFNLHICIVDGVSASFPYQPIRSLQENIMRHTHIKPLHLFMNVQTNQHIPSTKFPYMPLIMPMTQAFNKYILLQSTKVQNPAQTPL